MTLVAYGPAINDAIRRGDVARLSKALDVARKAHSDQGGDLGKAIKAGEAALKKIKKAK